ncbi:MAG: pyridoxal phosphate-dependent aminotransferase, partial [Acidobacteria bacterium]|nr:pyridoxal phosphate-dependent aminotransferase [Acidobacteriota bacterium]
SAKIGTHTYYCAPRSAQISALSALDSPAARTWVQEAQKKYAELGRKAAAILGVPEPEGSTFFFLDVGHRLDERGLLGFLEDCADRGVLLAPGPSFGPFPRHVRVCFTCAEPEVVERGVTQLAQLLAG